MCGITGAYAYTEYGHTYLNRLDFAVDTLKLRGPDANGTYKQGSVALGHTRLSIIDTTAGANQPFSDPTGRYTIAFNGEIFNYKELRSEFKDIRFITNSDTEVLLHLYIRYGDGMLKRLNGFFAFAIHDRESDSLFLARDRMGIKPLLVYQDKNVLIFGSEMKALVAFDIPRKIDVTSQFLYHQFNYTPYPHTIFEGVKEMEPGSFMEVTLANEYKNSTGLTQSHLCRNQKYWEIPKPSSAKTVLTYDAAKYKLIDLMRLSVQRRMVADVPLGSFLSGGIDSSVIATLASEFTDKLKTFSIGYADEPLFDETSYAQAVAKRIQSDHTVFKLTNENLFANLHQVLDYIDRPFADSSSLPVHILCMHTRKHVTVALSGDGADELFSGYNKHAAEFKAQNGGVVNNIIAGLGPLWNVLSTSRNSRLGNTIRKLQKFSNGLHLNSTERYWRWASFMNETEVAALMGSDIHLTSEYLERKHILTNELIGKNGIDEMLFTDLHQVLRNDMLTKVDLMSMANGLEIRVPFLDHEVVEFASSLPEAYKITGQMRKRIVQDAFRPMLPPELYQRPKHGFEVPLLHWFRTELKSLITDDLLNSKIIVEQGVFDVSKVQEILGRLYSNNPGDSATHIWNLIVFQTWWKRHFRV